MKLVTNVEEHVKHETAASNLRNALQIAKGLNELDVMDVDGYVKMICGMRDRVALALEQLEGK